MISNIALLIPVHPPHYHFIYSLIDKMKLNNIQIDTHLVFSNRADYDIFSMKDDIHHILLPEIYQTNSIVTYKKFFGLKQLANSKYDYIICCDSETDIICNNFTSEIINNKIKHIFDNKKIYAGDLDENRMWGSSIVECCAILFPKNYDYLKKITKNFTMYFWWSDLPVYRRTDIDPFLNMINLDDLIFNSFDCIIYQYYLILYHEFEILNITPITNLTWSFEILCTDDVDILNKLVDIKYGFSWNNKKMYELNKTFIESQKGFMIYHLDR